MLASSPPAYFPKFTVTLLNLLDLQCTHRCRHSYSQFEKLHNSLEEGTWSAEQPADPPFPPKEMFPNVQRRCEKYNDFAMMLARVSSFASTNAVTAGAGERGLQRAARCSVMIGDDCDCAVAACCVLCAVCCVLCHAARCSVLIGGDCDCAVTVR